MRASSCEARPRSAAPIGEHNPSLDPLPYDYKRVNPHRSSYARQNRRREGIVIYHAPDAVTDRIRDVSIVCYDTADGPNQAGQALPRKFTVDQPASFAAKANATDLLYCFEGATGINRRGGGAWSLMGFVLAREDGAGGYDAHVVFRGSRSGESRLRGYLDARGNPDWVTDAGYGREGVALSMKKTETDIAPARMHKGFGQTAKSMLPTILECVTRIHAAKGGRRRASSSPATASAARWHPASEAR